MNADLRAVLEMSYDRSLVTELLEAYEEAKRSYFLGGHRLSAVEGGRFCEAAYRILQWYTSKSFTPVGDALDTEAVARRLGSLPNQAFPKSVRIYLPRALRVVYDIRKSRDAAHLGDGIDPNLQDATLVVSVLDWVVAEFVRLSDRVDPDAAQQLVSGLVTRKYPIVQTFGRMSKVLRADLRAGDHVLVLLYVTGEEGVSVVELAQWIPASMRANLRRTLQTLERSAFVHLDEDVAVITRAGERRVEVKNLLALD